MEIPPFQVISLGDMWANGAIGGNCGHNTPNCEIIDDADFEVWRANFGRTVSSGRHRRRRRCVQYLSQAGAVARPLIGLIMLLF